MDVSRERRKLRLSEVWQEWICDIPASKNCTQCALNSKYLSSNLMLKSWKDEMNCIQQLCSQRIRMNSTSTIQVVKLSCIRVWGKQRECNVHQLYNLCVDTNGIFFFCIYSLLTISVLHNFVIMFTLNSKLNMAFKYAILMKLGNISFHNTRIICDMCVIVGNLQLG